MPISLGELADQFGCELAGDPDVSIETVATLQNAGPNALSFLASDTYKQQLSSTKAAAVILRADAASSAPCPVLIHEDPYACYARMASVICPPPEHDPGVHESAFVDPTARVAASAHLAPNAVVEAGATVGENTYIGPGAVIGPDCVVGSDCRVLANTTLVRRVVTGDRCIFHPGAVIGPDGFGNAMTPEGWLKVPQVGGVRIGSDVEIGANAAIDCGAIDDTVIGDGVRIDNLVHIAHNCEIGDHTAIAAQTGFAGSTKVGKRCMFAGQVGVVGHIEICDDTIFMGKCVVSKSVRKPGVYSGAFPGEELASWNRRVASIRRLDKLQSRVRELEKKEK